MAEDINIGAITEVLNDKADVDLENTDLALLENDNGTLTWNGKNVAIHPDVTAISATSGTVTLESNKVYKMTVAGATTFSLPTSVTAGIFNQIEVQIQMSSAQTIALGTSVYFTGEAPDLSNAGAYTLIYEYDAANSRWTVGGVAKA